MDAVDISRKLCLTAAIVGARTRKDLAAAFRRANSRTAFDVERANKWLQGRARPREQQIYDDWALVLGGVSGAWIADTAFDAFAERVCGGLAESRETLMRRAEAFGGEAFRAAARHGGEAAASLAGLYATYSYAWSPYFPGRLIRGAFEFQPAPGGLAATYTQTRETDRLEASGPVSLMRRALLADLREPQERTAFQFTLFPPMSLGSVLGGLVCGPAVLGADPQPSVSRVVMVRLHGPSERLANSDCILDEGASIAADLAALGARVPDPDAAQRCLAAFLAARVGGPFDHVTLDSFRALVALFDLEWMAPNALP
ncbi:hypothetical protein [Amaricoccus sp.]|uniref:hypothetical protein n=1 Tax=Amaricoccus sp. TaxID=1872485 RepID=UPI001B5F8003|nr:hypothetical protein [Amaricoccus sp.]MBP7000791.1 hypothetical protein [Amaricoccus sp.]